MSKNATKYLKNPKSKANMVADKIALVFFAVLIVSFFSTIFMAGMPVNREKGRDAKRLSDIKQLQSALELYADECGEYPLVANKTVIGSQNFNASFREGCPIGITMGTYMQDFPKNPSTRGTTWDRFMFQVFHHPIPGNELYVYCSTVPGSLECAHSSESYVISFALEKKAGNLSAGKHFATPQGIQ